MRILVYILIISCLFACQEDEGSHGHGHSHAAAAADEHEEEISLTAMQMSKIGMKLGSFEEINLKGVIKVNGVIESPAENKARISTKLSGIIKRVYVEPGEFVKKGGILASIEYPELLEWQEELGVVEGQLLFLEKEYERQKKLVAKEIAARKKFEKTESEYSIAKAKQKALRSKLKLMGLNPDESKEELISTLYLRSPIAGNLQEINVHIGTFIQPQQVIFEVVNNYQLNIEIKAFEKDLPFISIGQEIEYSLQSNPSKTMKTEIFSIAKSMNEEDRSVMLHAEIDKPDPSLIDGMYVEVRIIVDDQKVMALPESAITTDKGLNYIFVKEETSGTETHFKKVQVLTGKRDIGYVEAEALERLTGTEEIVVEGAFFLMAQSKKGEVGGGHHH
ncbi:MAG: efflux RND transporter periplasmic adaptor subunit [Bacteroidota bacterium]